MFPGDPKGVPREVYNCRCTMIAKVEGFNAEKFINSPIERNSSKGKLGAILHYGEDLNKRQSGLLKKLTKYDDRVTVPKNSVSMTDLSALTAATGDEFALFTRGSERLVIRGNEYSVNIHENEAEEMYKKGYRWSGHTHPGIDMNVLMSSLGDEKILACFHQKNSVIYNSKGMYLTFGEEDD